MNNLLTCVHGFLSTAFPCNKKTNKYFGFISLFNISNNIYSQVLQVRLSWIIFTQQMQIHVLCVSFTQQILLFCKFKIRKQHNVETCFVKIPPSTSSLGLFTCWNFFCQFLWSFSKLGTLLTFVCDLFVTALDVALATGGLFTVLFTGSLLQLQKSNIWRHNCKYYFQGLTVRINLNSTNTRRCGVVTSIVKTDVNKCVSDMRIYRSY